MRFELTLARRYLKAPSSGSAKITAYLAVAGIAIGVAAMIFALALGRGFREEVQDKLLANTPHINISRTDGGDVEDAARIKNELSNIAGIKSIHAVAYRSALLSANGASTYTVLRASEEIQAESKDGCAAVAIGSRLAEKAGLKSGDTARIILSAETDAPQSLCIFVRDIFTTGLFEYDSTRIDIALEDLKKVSPGALEVSVSNIYGSRQIADAIEQRLGAEYSAVNWQETNKPFFAAMDFERRVVLIIISLVILLAALNITFTLTLGVTNRRQDIAILRTSGAKARSIVLAFVLEGAWLGIAGTVLGVMLGLLACFILNRSNVLSLPPDVYAIDHITLRPSLVEAAAVIAGALGISIISALYPAYLAARVKPWENLRR
jgi:lipoprotein-releasing system permease protein